MKTPVKLLLIDDEEFIRKAISRVLMPPDFQVIAIGDGSEGYEKILEKAGSESQFDLIITDISLPGLSGVEMIKKIQAEGIEIPTLIMTGNSSGKAQKELAHVKKIGFISKPFGNELLLTEIEKVMSL